jgi:hypothetical protein
MAGVTEFLTMAQFTRVSQSLSESYILDAKTRVPLEETSVLFQDMCSHHRKKKHGERGSEGERKDRKIL